MPDIASRIEIDGLDGSTAASKRATGGHGRESVEHDEGEVRLAQAIEAGGRRYRFLAKAIPLIVWTATPEGKLDSFNTRWVEYTGLPTRQNRDRGWQRSLHPEDVRRWVDGWSRSLTSENTLTLDVRLRRADGAYRWHLARALPVRDRSGSVLKWLGTCTDIDDQKRAEGMLGFL